MEVIVLSGKSNSGKTTILDNLYNELSKNNFTRVDHKETDDPKDHRVFLKGKDSNGKEINVVITSPGDNAHEILLNFIFFIKCYFQCKAKSCGVDYWLLSEKCKNNNKHTPYIEKLFEIRNEHQNEFEIKTIWVTKKKIFVSSDKDKYVKEILEFLNLNIKEVKNEVQ